MMNSRKAKRRALERMEHHPKPHQPWASGFVRVGRFWRPRAFEMFEMGIGTIDGFRFIMEPAT